ncbi:MAG: hypothetical protein IJ518_00470 [Clostridia bacterium]|nr:hypothetical protein [Clostridia bacterium]
MKAIWAFVKFLIPVLPIVLAALLPMAINLKKPKRHLQLFLPVLALVYGIVFLLLVDDISQVLLNGIYYVLDLLADFIEKYEFLHFINDINWAYGILYVVNLAMLLLFVAIKSVLLPILSAEKPEKKRVLKFLTGLFYTYDEEDGKWYIRNRLAHAKKVMLAIHIGVLAFSSLLFGTTCYFISKDLLSVPFYPVFGILVFGECYFFLCGLPKGGEEVEAPGAGPEEQPEEVDYSLFKEIYEKLFGDRLSGSAELPPISDKRSSVEQLLQRYYTEAEETGSQEARLFYEYFRKLAAREDADLDDGLIAAARNILDGKNVLFNTPFYGDTTEYIFLPVTRHLMRGNKLLVIVGRTGADDSVIRWLREGLLGVNNFENLWKIDYLQEADEKTKIAILPMKDLYNQKLLTTHANFLEETSLVMVMDPTRLLGTMQVGLSNVVGYLRRGTAPQYIAYDRNCDGLVDSLSHVLGSSIEEVAATVVGSAKTTAMIWEADGQNLHNRLGLDTARYLGMGTELGAVAVAGKVSTVNWFAYDKFPATDIRWVVSQYYGPLCKVMDIPTSQAELEKRLAISADIWSLPKAKDRFIIAEDEYNNPYEIIRQFSSRASAQAFVHVLSQNYLLRDYMCENAEIFTYDPKAIPSFVPDYQRVRNNTVYRITMRLINGEIYEEEIRAALELVGIESTDVYADMVALITQCFIPTDSEGDNADGIIHVRHELVVDPKTHRPERKRVYSIINNAFIDKFLSQLQVVHYVAEDEQDKNLYMNSILYGHIYQKYLPGTFAVFDGKYYEVVSITRHSGMVVRRAADHVTRRRYHRQLRTYQVSGFRYVDEVASSVTFGNVCLEHGEAAVTVSTAGYLEQADFGDMKHATRVTLNGVPDRRYPHKNILRFKLEGADAKVRFTVATMMNELFVTLFPEMHEYIVATTAADLTPETEGYIPGLVVDEADEYIYVIEDSLIDMGLLINVERYFKRILEIVTDQLSWHAEQLLAAEEGGLVDEGDGPDTGEEGAGDGEDEAGGKKKGSWWQRFKAWLRRLFGRKKKKGEAPGDEGGDIETPGEDGGGIVEEPEGPGGIAEEPGTEGGADAPSDEPAEEPEKPKKPGFWGRIRERFGRKKKKADESAESPAEEPGEEPIPGADEGEPVPAGGIADESGADTVGATNANYTSFTFTNKQFSVIDDNGEGITGEDEESVDVNTDDPGLGTGAKPGERLPYPQRFYMLYGYDAVPAAFDLEGTLAYLRECGFADNYLWQARDNAKNSKLRWYNHRFEPGEHYCDFCGTKLEGTISVLKDGRERCAECKRTAITKVRDFRKLYKHAHTRMEDIFGIKIHSKISIRITNAKEIAEQGGYEFTPTPRFDGRALGFAQRLGNGHTRIVLENGAPRLETEKTLVHELTHVWQYENMGCLWEPSRDLVAIEGMAVWTEAQYLVCNGEEERAMAYVTGRTMEDSEYGQGMREYIRKYPLHKGKTARRGTPFNRPGQNPLN